MKRTLRNGNRVSSAFQSKFAELFKLAFGRIFVYEEIIVLETSSQAGRKSLPNCARPKSAEGGKVNIRLAGIDDIPKFGRILDAHARYTASRARERFRAGDLCCVAEIDGKIVSYAWVCFHEAYTDIETKIRVNPDSAYGYDEVTDPEYRGIGLLPMVLLSMWDPLFRNGIKSIYETVSSNNFPSLRAHKKIGSRRMGQITLVRLFKSKKYICKGETLDDFHKFKEMFDLGDEKDAR